MIILMGKSGAGKDTVLKYLLKRGYNKIPTVTTRPPRHNEVNGRSYTFTDDRTFRVCIDEGLFAEYTMYHSALGDWWYGSLKSNYVTSKDKDVIILTPSGYLSAKPFLEKNNIKTNVFLISASYDVRRKRLEKRGDNEIEIIRRMQADDIDFEGLDFINEESIISNNGNIEEAVNKIIERIEGEENR